MLNHCQFIGRAGKDPETSFTPAGDQVTKLSIACTESWKKNGERVEKTEWVNLVFWKKLAEIVSKYVHKGELIYVEGKQNTRSWEGKDGVKRYTTEIVATDMKMLTPKGGHDQNQSGGSPEGDVPF